MKNKKFVRVRAVRGYGPRHMMNAQEGSEAVPSPLPDVPEAPPDRMDLLRREIIRQAREGIGLSPEAVAEIRRNPLGAKALASYAQAGIMLMPEFGGEKPGIGGKSLSEQGFTKLQGNQEPPLEIPPSPKMSDAYWDAWEKTTGQKRPDQAFIDSVKLTEDKPGPQHFTPEDQALLDKLGTPEELEKQYGSSPTGKDWGNANDRKYSGPLVGQQWADIYATPDTEFTVGKGQRVPEGPLSPEDQADADYLNDLKTKHSLGQLPQPGPLDRPYLPPEGFKRGTRKVSVAKGFGPAHAENSKEGEDLTKVNTDTVPAMLTPREAVLNRNAAELAGRGTIEKLNSEGNKLARKGVDLAAGGMADVKEKIMKSKPKSSKPQSGSPYVQAFQNLMPKGGAPVGYQGGGDSVPGMGGGLGARDQYGRQFSNRDASGSYGQGNGVPGAGVIGVPGGPYGTRNDTGPGVIGGPMGGGPFPGRGPGGVYPGAMPGMQGPGTPPTQQGPFPGRGPGGVYPGGPMATPLADGTSNVGPIGTPPQGEQAYGPPVNLTAPQIQRLAQQTGISPGQIMGLVKAFQGGKDIYNSVGTGGYDTASPATSQAVGDAFGFGAQGMQGGISDIGYPPFVAPSASYDGNRGGWLGPYDPSFMIQRYAGGTSYVSPFR